MIPKYEEIMLPFLKYLADGEEHSLNETHDALAKQFKLTEDELKELLPSGQQPVFRNRFCARYNDQRLEVHNRSVR